MNNEETNNLIIQPALDMEKLQKAAEEYAMKGALKSIEDFYTGYSSPFRKAVEQYLGNMVPSFTLDLPGIMALLNEALAAQMKRIVGQTVAHSYIPMMSRLLSRQAERIDVPDIVQKFIDERNYEKESISVRLDKGSYGWYDLHLSCDEDAYRITLYEEYDKSRLQSEDDPYHYIILNVPCNADYSGLPKMKCSVPMEDGKEVKIELPFGQGVLEDSFLHYIANLVVFQTPIRIDRTYFDDMIESEEE